MEDLRHLGGGGFAVTLHINTMNIMEKLKTKTNSLSEDFRDQNIFKISFWGLYTEENGACLEYG